MNENRAHGLSLHDAIADAAANRLEPVLLTSLATILGLIPITIADPFWRGLGGQSSRDLFSQEHSNFSLFR
ncbi:efflux RND transporter permease subunit [Candidatus Roizmanbacteria bacterium]|nr:MAG: efflux RND transporter permease subunit [Candidatus Roizmanbacteria bacterium]